MTYQNPLMTELMVPRDPEVGQRIEGFYQQISWDVRDSTNSEYFTYVNPQTGEGTPPTIAYWQTETLGKIAMFGVNETSDPSIYARGIRLPNLQELVEVCLVVPSNEDVHMIFDRGGKTLERHTHIMPRDHAGAQEFRFGDPFNYSLRVTANPGWEIVTPPSSERVTADDFKSVWNARGAATTWGHLRRFAKSHPDFPLQSPTGEDYEPSVLKGSINSALSWLEAHPDLYRGQAGLLLKLVSESREQQA